MLKVSITRKVIVGWDARTKTCNDFLERNIFGKRNNNVRWDRKTTEWKSFGRLGYI